MRDSLQAILLRVKIDGPKNCWLWLGCKDKDGYARIGNKQGHRVTFEKINGPVPDGKVLDHFECDCPGCINPSHVKPVTPRENTLRGNSPAARNHRKTACAHGHLFDERNTYRHRGHRHCRACNRAAVARYKAGKRGAA